jgi:hypothetical protein
MTPTVGLPLGAFFTAAVVFLVLGLVSLRRPRASPSPVRVRDRRAIGVVAAGLAAGAAGLLSAIDYGGGGSERPFWAYVLFWSVFGAVPFLISFWVLAIWAKRSRPGEWATVTTRIVPDRDLSSGMRRAFWICLQGGTVPSFIAAWILFGLPPI